MEGKHSLIIWIVSLVIVVALDSATAIFPSSIHRSLNIRNHGITYPQQNAPLSTDFRTLYIEQPVDHFGYANQDTFLQRYLVVDKYWTGNNKPIFFYTGNEGDIAWFLNNTGLMFDWAPEFEAMLIFAEHRYYGTSMPYGNESYKDLQHLGFLTCEQALADFAVLIDEIKRNVSGAGNSPVVAFGGSYGGMLSAWFRIKYPHSIVGALASSAPIWLFGDLIPCDAFSKIVTDDFQQSDPNCVANIRKSWKIIDTMAATDEGRKVLTSTFGLCQPLATDGSAGNAVKNWLSDTWVNLAMVDYPYSANFLEPLPKWPIKAVCSHLSDADLTDLQLIQHLHDAVNVYYNYTGTTSCFNLSQQAVASLGDYGWDFQSCTEMVMPICSNGVTDMFENSPWNLDAFMASCKHRWGTVPRPNWILEQFGGRNISASSNIIFSNGQLDPWRAGGVTTSLSESLVSIVVDESAHHLDLRSSNPLDPQSVVKARQTEKMIIKKWLHEETIKHKERCDHGANVVILNGVGSLKINDDNPSTVDDVLKSATFQDSLTVFAILAIMFFGVIILVGFSGRQRKTRNIENSKFFGDAPPTF